MHVVLKIFLHVLFYLDTLCQILEFFIVISIFSFFKCFCSFYCNDPKFSDTQALANSADPDLTAPRRAV